MSLGLVVGWVIVGVIAVVTFRYATRKDEELTETEQLRAGLRARAEEYRKATTGCAKDQYFSLGAADNEQTSDEIDDHRRNALAAEQKGHALMLAAVTLDGVVKQPTKAKMIAVMQHYVLEYGQLNAQTADPKFEDSFLVTCLNGILAEIKSHDRKPRS